MKIINTLIALTLITGLTTGTTYAKPDKEQHLPPGLQKKVERGGELPPGWQMKVARGEVLAPDLYHGSRPLPEDLLERLGRHHHDSELRLLDDRVVRVVDDTRLILDVLQLY